MQRYGPPPSYPVLKIAGLNAPIPDSCSFGYHAGGWGKPPVDEYGKPLYGDVFGIDSSATSQPMNPTATSADSLTQHWGAMDEEASEEESEEEDAEMDEEAGGEGEGAPKADEEDMKQGLKTPGADGLATPSGISTVTRLVTPDSNIELRKRGKMGSGTATEDGWVGLLRFIDPSLLFLQILCFCPMRRWTSLIRFLQSGNSVDGGRFEDEFDRATAAVSRAAGEETGSSRTSDDGGLG